MNTQDFDRLLESVRAEDPGVEATVEAAARVRVRLASSAALPADRMRGGTRPALRWAMAAALIVAAGFTLSRTLVPSGPRATVTLVDGKLYRVSAAMTELVSGSPVGENEEIRSGQGSRAVLRLRDGSSVELAERTDLTVSEGWRNKTIHLERGAVLVEAAKQRSGRLEVATLDCLISVKGTIFGVSRGTKGSRVSVVEGEVKVDQDGGSQLLHRGEQTATSVTMASVPVTDEIAWSQNAPKYRALVEKAADKVPPVNLTRWLPENTVVYAAIPNLGTTLTEASGVFEQRMKERAIWNERQSRSFHRIVDRVRAFSAYLGGELVLAVPQVNGELQDPILFANVRRPGLEEFLDPRLSRTIHDGVIALSTKPVTFSQGSFPETPFGRRIAQSDGAGWLFAANLEQIVPRNVQTAGGNVRFLVIERKQNLGRTENRAALTFSGERTGIASWLAAPGPMGSLDFVSPEASFSASFVVKNAETVIREFLPITGAPDFSALGGEVTLAVDGPLLPVPSWKAVIEVDDPARLQVSIEKTTGKLTSEQIGGLIYYELTLPNVVVDYVFVDGYLLMAPNRALLTTAIRNRSAGVTLARSAAFRAQLPQDGHVNFSGLLYYNLASVGPIVDQLKSTGLIPMLTANRQPSLIYAYGEPDRIVAASRSGFFGLDLNTLVGLNAKGTGAVRQLLPPVFERNHATRN